MSLIRNLLAIAVFAVATPVLAGSGSWNNQTDEPLIYQTNFWYGPNSLSALNGTPASAVITNVSYSWGYYAATSGLNPDYKLEAKLCAGSKCGYNNANNKVGTSAVNDTYWAGASATANWTFSVHAYGAVTKAFTSALNPSRQFQLSVNYSY